MMKSDRALNMGLVLSGRSPPKSPLTLLSLRLIDLLRKSPAPAGFFHGSICAWRFRSACAAARAERAAPSSFSVSGPMKAMYRCRSQDPFLGRLAFSSIVELPLARRGRAPVHAQPAGESQREVLLQGPREPVPARERGLSCGPGRGTSARGGDWEDGLRHLRHA